MISDLIYCKILLFLIVGICLATSLAHGSCWLQDNLCNVKAEIYQNLELLNGVPMEIDCLASNESEIEQVPLELDGSKSNGDQPKTTTTSSSAYSLMRRFMGIQSVMLDGCQTSVNTHTYGLEFLPICSNVTKVALRNFQMDTLMPLQCGSGSESNNENMLLEYLVMEHNEFDTIDSESFTGNFAHLRVLEMEGNSLKSIQGNSLRPLRSLEHLRIVNEPLLNLNAPDIFEYTAVIAIHLEVLKHMTSEIFHHLPETVESLYVAYTQFDNDAVDVNNARTLVNLTLTNCALKNFSLRDIHSTVKSINLNGNSLKSFEAYENNVRHLDLSNNQLEHFDYNWAKCLKHLEVLNLKENHIKSMNIYEIVKALPKGLTVDVRANRLQSLEDTGTEYSYWLNTQLRFRCDRNPWDCLWLHDFAHSYPEKFRILQYDKFISKINVNGLECQPADKATKDEGDKNNASAPTNNKVMNVSTYHLVYGDPYDFRRNQRAEALIIVFMLPVGIAFLFLLLYLWIYCQKVFHMSYYKNISWMHRHPNVPSTSQRFDVVRQIPPQLQVGDSIRTLTLPVHGQQENGCYEVPLSGVCSECNCKSRPNSLGNCNKTIHITYEESPAEVNHQIYEEITSVSDTDLVSDDDCNQKKPLNYIHYDHLRFE